MSEGRRGSRSNFRTRRLGGEEEVAEREREHDAGRWHESRDTPASRKPRVGPCVGPRRCERWHLSEVAPRMASKESPARVCSPGWCLASSDVGAIYA